MTQPTPETGAEPASEAVKGKEVVQVAGMLIPEHWESWLDVAKSIQTDALLRMGSTESAARKMEASHNRLTDQLRADVLRLEKLMVEKRRAYKDEMVKMHEGRRGYEKRLREIKELAERMEKDSIDSLLAREIARLAT